MKLKNKLRLAQEILLAQYPSQTDIEALRTIATPEEAAMPPVEMARRIYQEEETRRRTTRTKRRLLSIKRLF